MSLVRLLILSSIACGAAIADTWTIGQPITIHEEIVPGNLAPPARLQLVGGRDTFLLAWLGAHTEFGDHDSRVWFVTVLSPEGFPLRADPLRLVASELKVVSIADGFAAVLVHEKRLEILTLDAFGEPIGDPRAVAVSESGFQGLSGAANREEILLVWTEAQARYDQPPIIRGVMVHRDGTVDHGVVRDTTAPAALLGDPHRTLVRVASNGTDFLIAWSDCLQSGSRFYSLSCGISSRIVTAEGSSLRPPSELVPQDWALNAPLGPIGSDGSGWIVLTGIGRIDLDADGAAVAVCREAYIPGLYEQLTWDGTRFLVASHGSDFWNDFKITRLPRDCTGPASEFRIGVSESHALPAIASLPAGSTLLAHDETIMPGGQPGLARIVVRTVDVGEESRRRLIRREGG